MALMDSLDETIRRKLADFELIELQKRMDGFCDVNTPTTTYCV